MNYWLLLPPLAFVAILFIMALELKSLGLLAFPKGEARPSKWKGKPYASGHDVNHRVRPDYSQFFHFAFFFTIMHVVALLVATVPAHAGGATVVAIVYLLASAAGLRILFRRW